jgi:DNA-binding response OmpR family regulator
VALARRSDEVLSRETLGHIVWGYDDLGTGHLIDVHIGRLRLKLRRASRTAPVIVTSRGRGYSIMAEAPASASAGGGGDGEASEGAAPD